MDNFVGFSFDQPYYFFMGWLLIALINMFIFMMMERTIYRKRDFEETIDSCAGWNKGDWTLVTVLSILAPFGWIVIIIIIVSEYTPELTKEREWPSKPKWRNTRQKF